MRMLCSIIALAVALGIGWPGDAEAQSKQTSARKAPTAQHKAPAKRGKKVYAKPRAVQKPCVRHTWFGCVGWDPDPNIRDMLAREVGDDDG